MNAIQTGLRTPRAGYPLPAPAPLSPKPFAPFTAVTGLLLATTGLIAPETVLAQDSICERESATLCVENKLKGSAAVGTTFTPAGENSDVTIDNNEQVTLSADQNNDPAWSRFKSLIVGRKSNGGLIIDNRQIQTSTSTIGDAATGSVTLTRQASWTLTNKNLYVAINNGDGTLTVEKGSQIDGINELRIGEFYAGATGRTTIEGENSRVSARWVVVGDQGEGRLDILDGGQLSASAHMNIGYVGKTLKNDLKGNGVVNVDGKNSLLDVSTSLILGGYDVGVNDARAELTVSNGGKVSAGTYLWAGIGSGSTAIVNIGGRQGEAAQAAGYIETPLLYLGDQTPKGSTAILNFNHTSDDFALGAKISGYGEVNHTGPGTTLLSGNNVYVGNTTISRGTVRAGSVTGFSLNSDFHVADGATLDLNGYSQTIRSLALDGTLTFGDPQAGRDDLSLANSVLTVRGHYSSDNGKLVLNTTQDPVLQKPVVNQLVVAGNTSGTTRVALTELGTAGVGDLNGARVVQVNGVSAGEFIADGRLVAGAYDYALLRGADGDDAAAIPNSNHWYLTNTWVPVEEPEPEPDPTVDPLDDEIPAANDQPEPGVAPSTERVMRPEMGAYLANRRAANTLFITRLHDRLGETQYIDPISGETKVTSLWLRNVGGHTRFHDRTGQLSSQSNRYVVQMGGDVAQWSSGLADRWHLGVMAGYANSQSNTRSSVSHYRADGTVSGYSAGLYATWYADNTQKQGTWLDAWMLYNWFDNTVRGENLAEERYHSSGITASLEAGHTFRLHEQARLSYWLQPQAQLTWMGVSAHDRREENGTRVRDEGKGNLQSRLGVKAYLQGNHAQDDDKNRRFQPFVEVNWLHNTRNDAVSMNDLTGSVDGAKNIAELRTGVEAKVNTRLHLWGNVGQQIGNNGFSDTQAVLGLKVLF